MHSIRKNKNIQANRIYEYVTAKPPCLVYGQK